MKKNIIELKQKVSQSEVEAALKTILTWIGEDHSREGLLETPDRVIRSYKELFSGYQQNAREVLAKTFDDTEDFSGEVILRDIAFASMCEHHMLPIIGKAHVAYIPDGRIVGLSKIARLVEMFARRLQVQERMTSQIAESLQQELSPKGVAVIIEAEHHCVAMRGASKRNSVMVTSQFTGIFTQDLGLKKYIVDLLTQS